MGEGDGGVLISGGDDEPVKSNMWTKRLGRRCRQASPRASSILSCHIVVDEEEAGEVYADVEVEAEDPQVVGDSISITDRVKIREINQNKLATATCVEPPRVCSSRLPSPYYLFPHHDTIARERGVKGVEGERDRVQQEPERVGELGAAASEVGWGGAGLLAAGPPRVEGGASA